MKCLHCTADTNRDDRLCDECLEAKATEAMAASGVPEVMDPVTARRVELLSRSGARALEVAS